MKDAETAGGCGVSEKPFPKESDLCAAFIAALPKDWTAYPEWAGFDILLVHKDGIQVGVEAKLALNVKVLMQAVEDTRHWRLTSQGPDFRAVLVPSTATGSLAGIAGALGITVLRMVAGKLENGYVWAQGKHGGYGGHQPFTPTLPDPIHGSYYADCWHDRWPWKRCDLPEVIPDNAAGCPAPLRLTPWKIAAIKIAILLDRRPVTRADFKALGINMARWTEMRWLARGEVKGTWVWGEHHPDFRREHPRNYDEIAGAVDRWAPPEAAPPIAQEALL